MPTEVERNVDRFTNLATVVQIAQGHDHIVDQDGGTHGKVGIVDRQATSDERKSQLVIDQLRLDIAPCLFGQGTDQRFSLVCRSF